MILDKITYAGENILTIYHRGFLREHGAKELQFNLKIGHHYARFTETVVEDESPMFENFNYMIEGLLDPKHEYNPYGDSACAYMEHYVSLKKPKRLFSLDDKGYNLSIALDHMQELNAFVEKHTGFRIGENPICYGDIFVFSCNERNYRSNKENSIILTDIKMDTTVIIRFKKQGIIVSTVKEYCADLQKEIQIDTSVDYDSHDIEIYEGEQLVYYNNDISYIRRIHLDMTLKGSSNYIKLNELSALYSSKDKSCPTTTHIGEPIDQSQELLIASNRNLKRILSENIDDKRTTFIQPGEYEKAFNIIAEVAQSAQKELWIFDPYFSDINGQRVTVDFLRLLSVCDADTKVVVFYSKDAANSHDASCLKTVAEQDIEIQKFIKQKGLLNIYLQQSRAPIHDRFVITRDKDGRYGGLMVGTSFNSMDRNHFCIFSLEAKSAKTILENLMDWLNSDNIVAAESL